MRPRVKCTAALLLGTLVLAALVSCAPAITPEVIEKEVVVEKKVVETVVVEKEVPVEKKVVETVVVEKEVVQTVVVEKEVVQTVVVEKEVVVTPTAPPIPTPLTERADTQELVWANPWSQRWDPARATGFDFYAGTPYIFGTLVRYDADGGIMPWLAESYDVSEDRLEYTFHLRKDLRFNTGNPVLASDFKYSWERAIAFGVWPIRFFENVEGARAFQDGELDEVPGIIAKDDYTLQVRMTAMYRAFLDYCAVASLGVVEAAQVEDDTAEKRWMEDGGGGAGSYVIESFDADVLSAVLVPNPYYFGETPQLQRITYLNVPDPQTRLLMFESGEVDVIWANGLDIAAISDPSNPLSGNLRLQKAMNWRYWPMRIDQPPFDDPKFREAFRYALDIDGIISKIMPYNLPLDAVTAPSPMWPGTTCGIQQDVERAKVAFEESGYAGDATSVPVIRAYASPGTEQARFLQAVQEQVKDVLGVPMELKITDMISDEELGKMHLTEVRTSRSDQWPGPKIEQFFWGKSEPRLRWTPFQDDEVDALIERAHEVSDDAEYISLYEQAHRKICEKYVFLPGWAYYQPLLVKPWVKDLNLNGFNTQIWDLEKIWIAEH